MSKIQKAISEAKVGGNTLSDSLAKQTGRGPQMPRRRAADQSELVIPKLADSATKLFLDEAILQKNRVIPSDQASAVATSYKMLRTRMLHQLRPNNWKTIAISSARRNAGKTLTSINAAISLSSEPNQRVILVDLDLRRPSIGQILGIDLDIGLTDYLENKARIEDIVVKTEFDRLLIIPNTRRIEESSEMLSSSRMKDFVQIVSSEVNSTIVLFDLPPLLEADDLLAFSPLVDALLIVVAEGETRRSDLQKSVDLIEEINVLGFVLNKSRGDELVTGYYY